SLMDAEIQNELRRRGYDDEKAEIARELLRRGLPLPAEQARPGPSFAKGAGTALTYGKAFAKTAAEGVPLVGGGFLDAVNAVGGGIGGYTYDREKGEWVKPIYRTTKPEQIGTETVQPSADVAPSPIVPEQRSIIVSPEQKKVVGEERIPAPYSGAKTRQAIGGETAKVVTPSLIPVPKAGMLKGVAEFLNSAYGAGQNPFEFAGAQVPTLVAFGAIQKVVAGVANPLERQIVTSLTTKNPTLNKIIGGTAKVGKEAGEIATAGGVLGAAESPEDRTTGALEGAKGALAFVGMMRVLGYPKNIIDKYNGKVAKAKAAPTKENIDELKSAYREALNGVSTYTDEQFNAKLAEVQAKGEHTPEEIAAWKLDRENYKKLQAELTEEQKTARTSELTGTPNRRAFKEKYQQYLNDGWTIVRMDGDNTLALNETYSHNFTDKVIRAQGIAIEETAKKYGGDAYHVSGDEEIMAIPPAQAENAYTITNEARANVASKVITAPDGKQVAPSVTAGIGKPGQIEELADEAATLAKHRKIGVATVDEWAAVPPAEQVAIKEARKHKRSSEVPPAVHNILQTQVLERANVPTEDVAELVMSSEADGKVLREITARLYRGELNPNQAARLARKQYDKLGKEDTSFDAARLDKAVSAIVRPDETPESFAAQITAGHQLDTPEGQKYYEANADAIDAILNKQENPEPTEFAGMKPAQSLAQFVASRGGFRIGKSWIKPDGKLMEEAAQVPKKFLTKDASALTADEMAAEAKAAGFPVDSDADLMTQLYERPELREPKGPANPSKGK
ncbi:MAG: diguanylate cyclase, partial [bacterium]